ncbi:MAG: hypothetical protein KGR26_01745 [Cyanobacteria bacterium REEB65]|nr:hypothetical protein [Cyanobacteria bacterium REEB65]
MNIIYNLIVDHGGAIEIANDPLLDELREKALEACFFETDNLNTYISDALDNVARYAEHVPDPAEVRGMLADEQLGDWQAVLVTTAQLATQARLEQQVDADIDRLKAAIHEAHERCFGVVRLHDLCPHGWAAHESENEWKTGTLYLWRGQDGDVDADMLRVIVSGGYDLWIGLVPAGAARAA